MVTLKYANEVERRVNQLLAEGNINAAQLQAANIKGGGAGVQNTLNRVNTAVSAATDFRTQVEDSQKKQQDADRDRAEAEKERGFAAAEAEKERAFAAAQAQTQREWEERQRQLQREDDARQVTAVVTGLFNEYGLGSLLPVITRYAQQGYNADAVMTLLREEPAYKARFPAMAALSAKNRGITEGAYIEYERTAAALERQYGLPQGMLMNNVTTLLSNEVSLQELNERVVLASAASVNAPEGLKETFRDFYGVDALAAYFLDPDIAQPLLEKQYATAQIGLEARRQNVGLQVDMATQLQELGLSSEQARAGFQQVRRFEGLSAGRGDTVQQPRMIEGVFGNQEAAQDIERAQSSRLGRFRGGGGFVAEREGVSGLAPTQR